MPLADLLAYDDGGGARQPEADHRGELVDIPHERVGRQHVLTVGHVSHNDREHRCPDAPHGLVADNGRGIDQETADDGPSGPEDAAPAQREPPAPEGEDGGNGELHHPADQGGRRRPRDAHGGRAKVSEDQHKVQERIHAHGHPEEEHPEGGIFRAPLDAGVDAADPVEDVREAHDLDVPHRQLHQLLVGRDEPEDLGGEEEGDQGQQGGKPGNGIEGYPQTAVDAVRVPPPPVLADQDSHAALEAENDHLDDEHGHVGGSGRRHLRIAQQTHHEDVREAQGGGDDVLQDHGRGQRPEPSVEAGFPA